MLEYLPAGVVQNCIPEGFNEHYKTMIMNKTIKIIDLLQKSTLHLKRIFRLMSPIRGDSLLLWHGKVPSQRTLSPGEDCRNSSHPRTKTSDSCTLFPKSDWISIWLSFLLCPPLSFQNGRFAPKGL